MVDIYRDAKRQGIYPPLFTDPEGDSCFSIYQIRSIKKCCFNFFFWNFRETTRHFPFRSQNSEKPRIFRVTGANQNARKLLSTDLVNTNDSYSPKLFIEWYTAKIDRSFLLVFVQLLFIICFHWRTRNYENLNKTHVKINLLLLLLLFHNFTHHSYDISQTLPRVQRTVNSNVIARFIDAFGIEVLQAIFQKLLFFTKRDFLRSISRQIRFGDNFEIIL